LRSHFFFFVTDGRPPAFRFLMATLNQHAQTL
jgi:hypothetical protein